MLARPGSDEFLEYYGRYIDQVPQGDLLSILDQQRTGMRQALGHLPPDRAGYRYAPDKWTIADVVQHLSDAERIFAYRALRIARGDETPLPSWDENAYAARTDTSRLSIPVLLDDWEAARGSTLSLFRTFDDAMWTNRGIASGHTITPRALAYIVAGHTVHHLTILHERYGVR
jgi:hypothetical protein